MYVAELRASKLWQEMLDGLWVTKHNLNISKENYWVSNESARWVIPHQVRARKYWLVYEIGELFYWHRLAKPTSRLGYAYVIMYTQKSGIKLLSHALTATAINEIIVEDGTWAQNNWCD